jgi:hypothetical protein
MSDIGAGEVYRELADIAVGVAQEWSITYASSLLLNTGAVSLHRDFRNFQSFERYTRLMNEKNQQDYSGLLASHRSQGPAIVVLLVGAALDRLIESNNAGEIVEFRIEEQDALEGIIAITTLN